MASPPTKEVTHSTMQATTHEEKQTPAADAVFATPELLENIIHSLPWNEILCHATRVNRTWNKVIEQSSSIRRKLHMPTMSTKAVLPSDYVDQTGTGISIPQYGENIQFTPAMQIFNPSDIVDVRRNFSPKRGRDYVNIIVSSIPEMDGWPRQSRSRMYITEPPCTNIYVRPVRQFSGQGLSARTGSFMMHDPRGIAYGSLLETISKAWKAFRVDHRGKDYISM
jgi:hypothetical protein